MSRQKILYLSCHEVLEREEVFLLHELGYELFSPGAFVCPQNIGEDHLRPPIPGLIYDPNIVNKYHKIGAAHPGKDGKDHLTKEFVDEFDIIIVMHMPRWIELNWEVMKHKRVIWRTIGQSISNTEAQLEPYRRQGLEIVRYSPKEKNIPGYIGGDTLIRFYKDPDDYGPWTGENERVITFCQDMKGRGPACNFDYFEAVTRQFPRHLFGPRNDLLGVDWATGKIPFDQMRRELNTNRCYFYTGTHPASYTLNFMESMMTGIPLVCIGWQHGNANYFPGNPDLYEIPNIINNGVNGFISDDPRELQSYIKLLLEDIDTANVIGQEGRKTAIKLFGKEQAKIKWKRFLG